MASKLQKLMTLNKFKTWLQEKNDAGCQSVGRPLEECGCPIATYLAEHGVDAVVDGNITVIGTDKSIDFPSWVTRFVDEVDRLDMSRVHPARALKILKEVA